MSVIGRSLEIILGAFFLTSALMKAMDVDAFVVQISLYQVVTAPSLVELSAYATLFIETMLGAAFLGGWRFRGATFAVGCGMTMVFTCLIAYAWRYHGLEDCGCFGKYVSMGPMASIAKNLVLIGVLGGTWYLTRRDALAEGHILSHKGLRYVAPIIGIGACGALVVVNGLLSSPAGSDAIVAIDVSEEGPFAQFQFDADGQSFHLGEGEHLVAFLSATCGHCQASVPAMNEYLFEDGLPPLVALMQSDSPESLEEFRMLTEPLFVTKTIPGSVFVTFLEYEPPPRIFYVRDGVEVTSWTWVDDAPSVDAILKDIASASSTDSGQ